MRSFRNADHSIQTILVLGMCGLASGCHTTERTGRLQLILISHAQEHKLGAQAYRQILGESKISTDAQMTEVVRRVGERIAEVASAPDFQWEFTLIESEQANAFCLPGGKIAVYTGILPLLQNEAGLAAVLGHEVAHALNRHGAERLSQNMAAGIVEEALKIGISDADPEKKKLILQAFGLGSQVGVLLPYSRTHELEADSDGLIMAAMAGYDPREAVNVWRRMQAAGRNNPPEFLSTHPSERKRISRLKEQMPAALEVYNSAPQRFGRGQHWGGLKRP